MSGFDRIAKTAYGRLQRFWRDASGAMIPHVLIFFVLMLMLGGIAVDVMRFETRRVAVQNTLDRATLAAASLEQKLDPKVVVADYFEKAGLGTDLERVTVQQGVNFRIVDAYATVVSKNYFMPLLDVDTLTARTSSQAEQRVTNVEIALVLDVSGSMYNSESRIRNLKRAAKDFVDTVLKDDVENKISLSIVPYNGQVNLGPELFARYTVSHRHSYADSYCIDLPTSSYASSAISQVISYPQAPFIDTFTDASGSTTNSWQSLEAPSYNSSRKLYSNVWCNPVAGNYVRLHNNNTTTLKAQIDGLVAIGATSIDIGMKWGTAVLDPSAEPIVAHMIASGTLPAHFRGRPAAYADKETMKVIVLMTDGENYAEERVADDSYRSGPSPIFRATGDQNFSRFDPSKVDASTTTRLCNSRPYWVPHRSEWQARPWNGTNPTSSTCYSGRTYAAEATAVGNVRSLNWQDIWPVARAKWVAWQLYARAESSNGRSAAYNGFVGKVRALTSATAMDSRLATICGTAKSQGIEVYGIAFESTSNGQNAIRNCTSWPKSTYYFDVSDEGLLDAFAAIASNLSRLRLTQ